MPFVTSTLNFSPVVSQFVSAPKLTLRPTLEGTTYCSATPLTVDAKAS